MVKAYILTCLFTFLILGTTYNYRSRHNYIALRELHTSNCSLLAACYTVREMFSFRNLILWHPLNQVECRIMLQMLAFRMRLLSLLGFYIETFSTFFLTQFSQRLIMDICVNLLIIDIISFVIFFIVIPDSFQSQHYCHLSHKVY